VRHAARRNDLSSIRGVGRIADMTLPISLHGPMNPLLRRAAMMYAAIHGRQKKVGIESGGSHATPDDLGFSDARRGPFWSHGTSTGLAGLVLRPSGNVDANSGDWNDVRYVPKWPRSSANRNTSARICVTLHLRAERISDCPRATCVPVDDSAQLSRNLPQPFEAITRLSRISLDKISGQEYARLNIWPFYWGSEGGGQYDL